MADDRGTLRQVAWFDLFPSLTLVRAVRVAFAPRLILLAALGLVATTAGWRAIGWAYSGSDELQQLGWLDEPYGWPPPGEMGALPPLPNLEIVDLWLNPLVECSRWFSRPFIRLFDREHGIVPWTYSLSCALWELAVWALIGGAITRIAALTMARETRVGLVGGLRFGLTKWPAYFFSALVPMTVASSHWRCWGWYSAC